MWSTDIHLLVLACFILAGIVKGLIGLGFPTIILAMLSLTIGVREAMAIMLLPCLLTNVWQSISGGNLKLILQRLWPLLLTAIVSIWITTAYIAEINTRILSCFLGIIVIIYAIIGLTSPFIILSGKHECWLTPAVGVINGIVTGLTGSFVVPGALYLQSLKMERDVLIQALGVLFLVSTMALGTGLYSHNLMSKQFFYLSALAVIPSLIGMVIGMIVRKLISEKHFQIIFYFSLLILGTYIFGRNITWFLH